MTRIIRFGAAPSGGRDELSQLITSFNDMLSQIQERDAALRLTQNELEHRVEERTQELATTNRELESFSYSVSHDLRAPLRSIDGFSQALLEDYSDKLDPEGQNHLQRVRRAAQHMATLIDDMLNLSRVSRSQILRENLDLSGMAKSIAAELRETDPARRVEFFIEDGLVATGDSHLMRAALGKSILAMPGSTPRATRRPGSNSARANRTEKVSSSCATMEQVSIRDMRGASLEFSSVCIRRASFQEPGSGLLPCNESYTGMGEKYGRKAQSRRALHFTLRCNETIPKGMKPWMKM